MKVHRVRTTGTLVAAIAFMLALGATAQAGLLSDHFGVTLEIDVAAGHTDIYQSQTTYPTLQSSYTPTANIATTDWIVDDWHGCWSTTQFFTCQSAPGFGQEPAGGEPYDVEAVYFDDDPYNYYIAIVTSFDPPPGRVDPRVGGGTLVVTGDLALDWGLNPQHSVQDPFRYDYGVDVNNEARQASGDAVSGGTAIGDQLYRTANTDWYLGTPSGAVSANGENTNFDPTYSGLTPLGTVASTYTEYTFASGLPETLYPTRVVEVTIPRQLLPNKEPGDTIGLGWVMGCRIDGHQAYGIMRLDDAVIDTPQIPEPATVCVFGVAVAGLMRRRKRRRA